jgi:hypothetical protein
MNELKVGDRVNIDLAYDIWHDRHSTSVCLVRHAGHFKWTVENITGAYAQLSKGAYGVMLPIRFISKAIEQAE